MHELVAAMCELVAALPGTVVGTLRQPGVHPFVDLRTDPLDQALGDRAVIVAAKFAVRRRRGSNVISGDLLHGDTIHLDHRLRPCPCGGGLPDHPATLPPGDLTTRRPDHPAT